MPYSITGSTKTLIYFGNSTILFILVGTLCVCEFAMVPGVYILLCPQEEKEHSFSYIFNCAVIKRFKLLSLTILLWEGHC